MGHQYQRESAQSAPRFRRVPPPRGSRTCLFMRTTKGMLHLSASANKRNKLLTLGTELYEITISTESEQKRCQHRSTPKIITICPSLVMFGAANENMPMACDLWLESFALQSARDETRCCETVSLLVRFDPSEVTRLDSMRPS